MRRGQAAAELLNNPLFNEALTALETDLISQLRSVSLADVNAHTRLAMAFQVTGAMTRHLKHLIHDGEAAVGAIQLRGKRID